MIAESVEPNSLDQDPALSLAPDFTDPTEPAETAPPKMIAAMHAGPLGSAIAGAITAFVLGIAGWFYAPELVAYPVAVGFLAIVVQQDTRHRKIPNWLTGAGLLFAVAHQAWAGGASAAGLAVGAALLPFGLLILPYAVGALGAGDIKVFMVLGALWGAGAVLSLIAWTTILAGAIAVIWVAVSGELGLLLARWWIRLLRFFGRPSKEEPVLTAGVALQSAMPLGLAIAGAVAVQVAYGGFVS